MAPEAKAPWDGIERRIAQAPVGVTALKIANRVVEDGETAVSEENVREGDLGNNELTTRVGDILATVNRSDKGEAQSVQAQDGDRSLSTTSEAQKRELTPEQAIAMLQTLSVRFQNNPNLHKGINFEDVKKSLEANPEALWSVAQMEAKGHEPDVYNNDEQGFDIGTCSKESPASARNCVYDKEAADWLKENKPNETFNGSAVEMAQEMGIDLMDPNLYENFLQKKGKFDLQTWSWLLTHSGIRSTGNALNGNRSAVGVRVVLFSAYYHYDDRAFRGSLRVSWKA